METSRTRLLFLVLLLFCGGCTFFQPSEQTIRTEADSIVWSGRSLIKGDFFEQFTAYNSGGIEPVKLEIVSVDGSFISKVFRVTTSQKPDQVWGYSINTYNSYPVKKGEVVFASLYVRALANKSGTAKGNLNIIIMEPMPSYALLGSIKLGVGRDFREVRIAFKTDHDYNPAELQFGIQFGYEPQAVEIGDITFVNCGGGVKIKDLALSDGAVVHKRIKKKTASTYQGRDKNAPWRKEAAERIEKIRKGDLIVFVKDEQDKAIENAKVQVNQLKHKFWFGNENRALLILSDPEYLADRGVSEEDAQKYREKFKELFNITAFGNDLVWNFWYSYGKEKSPRVYDEFLAPNNIALRGIPLIWSGKQSWKNPLDLFDLSEEELKARLISHMTEMMVTLKGRAAMWDVLNEPISEPDFINKVGRDEAVKWFKLARELEPEAKLYCNDYGILADRGKLEKFIELVRYLLDKGAPIDGVSPQSHLWAGQALPSIEYLKEGFDMLAGLGLEIYPDQFEVIVPDEQLHSDYTRDFYILAFSHPSVVGVTHWGFWEGEIWMADAAWFRKDWSPKKFAKVYKDLVFNKWWTEANGRTNDKGLFETRAFLGEYEVIVKEGDQTKKEKFNLGHEGKTVAVTLSR
jgi:endo-1,4-beta-xylanase